MRVLVAVVIGLLAGCSRKPAVPKSPWLIESWDKEVFTIQNEGNVYKATCDGVTSLNDGRGAVNGTPWPDALDSGTPPPRCELTIGLVGHSVESYDPAMLPAADNLKDADGWITTMVHSGSTLMLRSWRDEKTHTEELFKVTSVTKMR